MQPRRLRRVRTPARQPEQLAPFLYVSGQLYRTARGLLATLERRGYDVKLFDRVSELSSAVSLPLTEPRT
jgi:hypothetical protein